MNILFFDTETNGKPLSWKANMKDVDNWPRIIQLAWQIADDSGKVLEQVSQLIKPDGWTIPVETFWINHGYTTQKNEDYGIIITSILDRFIIDLKKHDVKVIVAHNMAFDINVLGAEMIRYGRKPGRKPVQLCTMLHGTNVCKIPGTRGGYKWPKLEELYRFLFNEDFSGAHDAGADVTACRLSFFELLQREAIGLPVETSV